MRYTETPNRWQTLRRVGTSFSDSAWRSILFLQCFQFQNDIMFLVIFCDLFCFLPKLTLPSSNKLACHYLDFPGIFPISKGLRWFGFSRENAVMVDNDDVSPEFPQRARSKCQWFPHWHLTSERLAVASSCLLPSTLSGKNIGSDTPLY